MAGPTRPMRMSVTVGASDDKVSARTSSVCPTADTATAVPIKTANGQDLPAIPILRRMRSFRDFFRRSHYRCLGR